jgi:formate dehydrogenase gamma subunit
MMDARHNVPDAPHTPPGIGILPQKLSDRLAEVLRRALLSTGGSGAAIALLHKDGMVTCARAGCAPDLGTRVNIHGSLAGLCVRTGRTVQSDDLQTDPRANGAAWRTLNVSSMVVTPVRKGDATVGILAVFSDKRRAFLSSHGVALEMLALALGPTPANYCPPPPQIRRTPVTKPLGAASEPVRKTQLAPDTTPVRPPVAAAPTEPLPVAPTLPHAAAHKLPQAPEISSVRLPVAAAPTEPLPVAPSLPRAAAHKLPQAPEISSVRLPAVAVPSEPVVVARTPSSSAATKNVAPVAPSLKSTPSRQKSVEAPRILRFRKSERMLHWSIAIPFLVCFASALILMIFYNPHPQRSYRLVFSLLHRISGACLMVFPALTALRNRNDHRIHLYNIKQAFGWVADDVKWLFLMGAAALSSKVTLPEQGKFNAAEKLNFIMVLCTYPLFIATGIILWGLRVPVAAWMLHVGMAGIAAPLVLGHIFMATINPETRVGLSGMLTGYVDRHWARHHYTRWYREQFESGHAQDKHHGEKLTRRRPLAQCPSEVEG